MKQLFNFLTIIACVLMVSTTTGCKKYTCECTAYNTNNPELGSQSNYTVKKKNRDKLCTDKSTQPDSYGNYTTCVIE